MGFFYDREEKHIHTDTYTECVSSLDLLLPLRARHGNVAYNLGIPMDINELPVWRLENIQSGAVTYSLDEPDKCDYAMFFIRESIFGELPSYAKEQLGPDVSEYL